MIIENPLFVEEIPENGAAKGHVRFALKSKAPDDIALVGFCANIAASLLFERLQAQGTNIVITLRKDDAGVDVLARHENDGVNLTWTPKPADPASLAQVQERISNKTFLLTQKKDAPAAPIKTVAAEDSRPKDMPNPADREKMSEEEEDYLVKQLHRIP
jgi:hypothetical protein